MAHHFRGKPPAIRALFNQFAAAVRALGPVRILPEKTRIAFQVRMSFAQVTPRQRWLDGHVVLARRLDHPRFLKIETFSPRNHLHAFRIAQANEIDEVFRGWLAEAYLVGDQQHVRRAKLAPMALTADDFRRIALGMKDVIESAHMGHPDFRVNGRIFATLHADMEWGMVKVSPEEQQTFLTEHPRVFKPESGAWGRQGCTAVRLDAVDEETLGEALTLAWRNGVAATPSPRKRSASTRRRT